MRGKLYIVGTPIGNLGDFSPRAQQVLNEVDFIAAEDTRVGAKLLNKFEIKKPQISYFEHNKNSKGEQIAARINSGENCALITDAGMPAISDPGTELVQVCAAHGIEIVAVPGPCAAVAALAISGIECIRWCFEGFLSMNKKARREHLEQVCRETRTMVFYEAPHKLKNTLEDMLAAFGNRQIALGREITKMHEEVIRTTFEGAIELYRELAPRGEYVIIISGAAPQAAEIDTRDPMDTVADFIEDGLSISEAVKQAAKMLGIPKNSIYNDAQQKFGEK